MRRSAAKVSKPPRKTLCRNGEICNGTHYVEKGNRRELCECYYLRRRLVRYVAGGFPKHSTELTFDDAAKVAGPFTTDRLKKLVGCIIKGGLEKILIFDAGAGRDPYLVASFVAFQAALVLDVYSTSADALLRARFANVSEVGVHAATVPLLVMTLGADTRNTMNGGLLVATIEPRLRHRKSTIIACSYPLNHLEGVYGMQAMAFLRANSVVV